MTSKTHKTIVVKVGGKALDADATPLWTSLAQAQKQGARIIVVHGGGVFVDQQLERLGFATQRHEGLRITPADQIDHVVGVLAGTVNKRIVGSLNAAGAHAAGLSLGDSIARTTRTHIDGVDIGCVGRVIGGSPVVLNALLDAGVLPVLSSIGLDEHGKPLNVNADDAAAGIASIIAASSLVLLTDVSGIRDSAGAYITQLASAQVESLVSSGVIQSGMIPKARAAALTADMLGMPVVIAGWQDELALSSLLTGGASGTRIVPDESLIRRRPRAESLSV